MENKVTRRKNDARLMDINLPVRNKGEKSGESKKTISN